MGKLRVLDLFSGIGGFSLGLERTGGFETVAFCEIDPFCRKVLAKHWPKVRQYEDVRTLSADTLRRDGIAVDVICGGFPCQDISISGRKAGLDGERSGLWSEIVRLARDLRPRFIIVENVANLLSGPDERPGGWFGRILGDLAELGFDAEWENIPAAALGAPHRRERVWIVAHAGEEGRQGFERSREGIRLAAFAASAFLRNRNVYARAWSSEPREVGGMAHGLPRPVDAVGALGNAVVPQIPEIIGRAILASLEQREAA